MAAKNTREGARTPRSFQFSDNLPPAWKHTSLHKELKTPIVGREHETVSPHGSFPNSSICFQSNEAVHTNVALLSIVTFHHVENFRKILRGKVSFYASISILDKAADTNICPAC